MNFCSNCGSQLQDNASFCSNCGAKIHLDPTPIPELKPARKIKPFFKKPDTDKSLSVAGFLGIFFGFLGIHNFYIRRKRRAMIQLFCAVFGILFLFVFPFLYAKSNMYKGNPGLSFAVSVISIAGAGLLIFTTLWSFFEWLLFFVQASEKK